MDGAVASCARGETDVSTREPPQPGGRAHTVNGHTVDAHAPDGGDGGLSPVQVELIRANTDRARSLAARLARSHTGYETDEMIGTALLALTAAGHRWPAYCAERGFDPYTETGRSFFRTYATRCVNGACYDVMRDHDHATRAQRGAVKTLRSAGFDPGDYLDPVRCEWDALAAGVDPVTVGRALPVLMAGPGPSLDQAGMETDCDPRLAYTQPGRDGIPAATGRALALLPPVSVLALVWVHVWGGTPAGLVRALTARPTRIAPGPGLGGGGGLTVVAAHRALRVGEETCLRVMTREYMGWG